MIPIIIIAIVFVLIVFILLLITIIFRGGNRKLKEGMRLEAAGKYFEALSIYDYLLKDGHNVPELRWKIANISLKINNAARAQKELSILLESGISPENVSMREVKKVMVECYKDMGKIKEAFVTLVELFRQDSHDPVTLFELAKIYAGQKLTGRAIRLLQRCLKYNPNDYELNYFIGKAYLDFGDADKALIFLEKTNRLKFFDNGRVNYYLGILYFSKKEYNVALQHFSQVLSMRPNDNRMLSETHHFIALCYKEKGLVDESITNFEKSQTYSELLPKDAQNKKSLYNEGVLLYKNGQYKKALEKFYKVKMLDYKYRDVEKIIKELSFKLKSGGKITDNIATYITENPLMNILKRGLLYSKYKFNIGGIESKAANLVNMVSGNDNNANHDNSGSTGFELTSVSRFNSMPSKNFKDIARRLVKVIGYQVKSEPKFFGDNEYIDGNAINFFTVPVKNPRVKKDILITIRRYKDLVQELSVSRFIEWFEEKNLEQGIFIASNSFSNNALKVINSYPHIRFIDRNGLARMLGRLK